MRRQAFGENKSVRLYEEFEYAAGSWDRSHRVIFKAEVMAQGDNPRFVVTSMNLPDPHTIYTELYCARGNAENFIKHLKCDLTADRTSCTTFLANCLLVSDGKPTYQYFAQEITITHKAINLSAGVHIRGAYHVQNVNAYHNRFKNWLNHFHGVATNYLGWRRAIDTHRLNTLESFLRAAIGIFPHSSMT